MKENDAKIKELIRIHHAFEEGVKSIIRRGKIPQYGHETIKKNLAKAHGFIEIQGFYIHVDKVEEFKALLDEVAKNKS